MPKPLPGLPGGEDYRPIAKVHPQMAGDAGKLARIIEGGVRQELFKATKRFTRKTKITGVSFVLMGVRMWWEELMEINPVAAADYLRALADLGEAREHEAKVNAEERRADAVQRLIHGVAHMPEMKNGK